MQRKPSSSSPPTPTLNARAATIGLGQVEVYNDDAFDWTDVELTVNGGMFSGYRYRAGRIAARSVRGFALLSFADSDGARFEPLRMKVQKLWISAKDAPTGTERFWACAFE